MRVLALLGLLLASASVAAADDWPTYGHDAQRSASSNVHLSVPLTLRWKYQSANPPSPAWPPPAKHDYWHYKRDLRARNAYDRVYQPVIAQGHVFFGTSTDDRVVCLDANDGHQIWAFFAQGPVRMAPTIAADRLYVGADDGYLYCISAGAGRLIWKCRIGPTAAQVIGNARMISRWPIRSGVVVDGDCAVCIAGLFPTSEGVYFGAVELDTGKLRTCTRVPRGAEGYLASSGQTIYAPAGRTTPSILDRRTGKLVGTVSGPGGAYALVDEQVIASGAGDLQGELALSDRATRSQLVAVPGRHMISTPTRWYIHGETKLRAIDSVRFVPLAKRQAELRQRMKKLEGNRSAGAVQEQVRLKQAVAELRGEMDACRIWEVDCRAPDAFARAGDLLLTGGDGLVAGYRTTDGQRIWQASIGGRVGGLAVSAGQLIVSTTNGAICCYGATDAAAKAASKVTRPTSPETRDDAAWTLAKNLLADTQNPAGFLQVVGASYRDLAEALVEHSRYRVLLVCDPHQDVTGIRQRFMDRGLYGTRIVVHQQRAGSPSYPPYFANVTIAAASTIRSAAELSRLLRSVRPHGGTLWLARADNLSRGDVQTAAAKHGLQLQPITITGRQYWKLSRPGALPGAGRWSHGLADPANTACSQDERVSGPLRLQWFGGPGPRLIPDRHHRNVPPVYANGRLFVSGENVLMAIDAFNGSDLWRRQIPDSVRLGAFLDCGSTVVDDQSVYVAAADKCCAYDQANGTLLHQHQLPQLDQQLPHRWGYVARVNNHLFGSACRPGAAYRQQSRSADMALWYDNMALVTSDWLFALNQTTDAVQWQYRSGVIINTTITIGDNQIFFLESHAQRAVNSPQGRASLADLHSGPTSIVALDVATGKRQWQQPFDLENCRHIVYLSYADGRLVLTGNKYREGSLWYHHYAFSARDGSLQWHASQNSGFHPGGDHGEQNRHPTIVGQTVYAFPFALDLAIGKRLPDWKFDRSGHGCGNLSASAHSLFFRGTNPRSINLDQGAQTTPINSVTRPGCFINMIPAGGLLLIPEASSGCTCQYAVQSSLAYLPASEEDDVTSISAQ